MTDRERREASDMPGFGRVGGIDDPVPRAEYSDVDKWDRGGGRNNKIAAIS